MKLDEYNDKYILVLRKKYNQKRFESKEVGEEILIGSERIMLRRECMLNGECSMLLPENWIDMENWRAAVSYRNANALQVIKAENHGNAVVTLCYITEYEKEPNHIEILEQLDMIRQNMRKLWKRNVFYDTGIVHTKEMDIPWMDMKAFCLSGSYYSLMFLFETERGRVFGNFHCNFERYDTWKPIVLKLLSTLQTQDKENNKK